MRRNTINAAALLLVILAIAGLYYFAYRAIDLGVLGNTDSTVRSLTFSEESERQIAATIGQGITFVGTVLAIILAISALRTSKSQGTISAIGAFKPDFDTFVAELATCRDKLKEVVFASGELAGASHELNHALFRPPYEDEDHDDRAWKRYQDSRHAFVCSVKALHSSIASSSNQFLVATIESNLLGAAGEELRQLREDVLRCQNEGIEDFILAVFSQNDSSSWEMFKALEQMSGLGCLTAFRTDEEISDQPIEDRVEEQNWIRDVKHSLLGQLGVSPRLAGPEIAKLVAYLPCLPAPGVFTEGLIDVYSDEIGDSFSILDSRYYAYHYPSDDRPRILPKNNRTHALPVYARIFRIYALILDAEPGLESIKRFLADMNGEREVVDPLLRGYRQKIANLHTLM